MAQWVRHRFGAALLPFADAVFTGTYAGDIDRLSMDAVMPGVRAIEKEHGSVLRGLFAKFKENRKAGKKGRGLPAMLSFPGGMRRLPEKLAGYLRTDDDIIRNCCVQAVRRGEKGWEAVSEKGVFTAANLVLALPVNAALTLLHPVDPAMPLRSVPEAQLAVIALGFGKNNRLPPGFGYLIPEQEGRFSLGSLFSSNMFPGRAPEGHILLETLAGGRRHPERLEYDDATLVRKALADTRDILGIHEEPVYAKVMRSRTGIPQLESGYPRLLAWRNALVARHPALYVCGFGWEGIGVNDMMKSATRTAAALLAGERETKRRNEVKAVYF